MLNNILKMDFDLLTDIIAAFKQYQLSEPGVSRKSLSDFTVWLNEQRYLTGLPENPVLHEITGTNEVEVEIGKLIIYLNRYAKLLIKKGLADFPELVNEDFTYLYTLMTCESMTKIQLIEKNIHEKPTGLEVIKRLLKFGMIGERNDEKDKRSKRVFLTDKGKSTFYQTLDQMGKVSRMVSGKLSRLEKNQLFSLLKKLEDFHSPLFLEHKTKNLGELEKLLS